jgi:hypothetical protein
MMMQLSEGRRTTIEVPIGKTLVISAGTFTGSLVPLPNPAGGEPGAPVMLTGAAVTLGPFTAYQSYRVHCATGLINYDVILSQSTSLLGLPTSPGATGTLWNNGGVISVVQ